MARKYSHTRAFYKNKLKEIKQWQKKNRATVTNPFRNLDNFISAWEATDAKNKMGELKFRTRYETHLETVRKAREHLKNTGVNDYKVKDLMKMTTNEIADLIKDDIKARYNMLKDSGYSTKEAAQMNAEYFFGS